MNSYFDGMVGSMHIKKIHIGLLAAILVPLLILAFIFTDVSRQPETSARLLVEEGSATVTSAQARDSGTTQAVIQLPTSDLLALTAGDRIIVADSSAATIILDEGSRLTLEEGSTLNLLDLQMEPTGSIIRLELLAGRMLSRIEPLPSTGSTYEVLTPSSAIIIDGATTVFTVEVLTDEVSVATVEQGRVRIEEIETGNEVDLTVGQIALVRVGQPIEVQATDNSNIAANPDSDVKDAETSSETTADAQEQEEQPTPTISTVIPVIEATNAPPESVSSSGTCAAPCNSSEECAPDFACFEGVCWNPGICAAEENTSNSDDNNRSSNNNNGNNSNSDDNDDDDGDSSNSDSDD